MQILVEDQQGLSHRLDNGFGERLNFLQHRFPALAVGDVAGGGEDAQDVALRVLVHRGVVEDVGELAVVAADGQRVVGDEALGEGQLVALAGLFRLREIGGEVAADKLLARRHRSPLPSPR